MKKKISNIYLIIAIIVWIFCGILTVLDFTDKIYLPNSFKYIALFAFAGGILYPLKRFFVWLLDLENITNSSFKRQIKIKKETDIDKK